jgi:hypothetical protein
MATRPDSAALPIIVLTNCIIAETPITIKEGILIPRKEPGKERRTNTGEQPDRQSEACAWAAMTLR